MVMEQVAIDLLGISHSGSFCAHGEHDQAPMLEIEGLGTLPLPIVRALLPALVRVSEPAPYGRGPDTLVDPEVRSCRQIAPERVRVPSSWRPALDAITREAAIRLGVVGPVRAHLYKLLVYGPGDFFVPHRDTEKEPGMFGTLVVTLPGDFSGGELLVRHRERQQAIDLAGPSGLRWAAFYADCTHELRPLESGVRVAMVYNLVLAGAPSAPAEIEEVVERVGAQLRSWSRSDPVKLAWLLEHRYSEAELGWERLKGADHGRAHALRQAALANGANVRLAQVRVDTEWCAEELSWRSDRWRRRSGYRDGDAPPADLELYDLIRDDRRLTGWVSEDGRGMSAPDLPLEEGEVCPPGALDGEAPDHVSYYEATGNEGATLTRMYRRAAVVVWPRQNEDAVLAQRGVAAVAQRLPALEGANRIRRIVRRVLPLVSEESAEVVLHLVEELIRHGLPRLAARVLDEVRDWDAGLDDVLMELLSTLDHSAAGALGASVIPTMWSRNDSAVEAIRVVSDSPHPVATWAPMLNEAAQRVGRWRLSSVQLADLVEAAHALSHAVFLEALIGLLDRAEGFDLAVDATLELDLRGRCPPEWLDVVVQGLEERTETAPTPLGLARSRISGCRCAHCSAVSDFLEDPERETLAYGVRQDLRHHVRQHLRPEMDLETHELRTSSPYKLVLTKVNRRYERAKRRYEEHLDALEALNATP